MKNNVKTYFLAALVFLSSCKKEATDYIGPEGVYFGVREGFLSNKDEGAFIPNTKIEFMKMGLSSYIFNMPILICGPIKNYDRSFKIIANPDSTSLEEGKHFEKLKDVYIIPKGAYKTTIPIKLFATEDLKAQEKKLFLQIVETPDFIPAFENWESPVDNYGNSKSIKFNNSEHVIYVNNSMVKPTVWHGWALENGLEQGTLGFFTPRKMELITKHLGIKYNDFLDQKKMNLLRMALIGQQISKILIEQYNAGTPILEDDGRLMYMEGVPWSSFINIPWKPNK